MYPVTIMSLTMTGFLISGPTPSFHAKLYKCRFYSATIGYLTVYSPPNSANQMVYKLEDLSNDEKQRFSPPALYPY